MQAPGIKAVLLLCVVVKLLSGSSVTIGTDNAVNALPFSDAADSVTVYQQVYASSAFSAPIWIDAIDFFLEPSAGSHNQLVSQTVTISLSTTSIAVDGLYYHAPQGADVQTFGTFVIGGTSPNVLTFDGTPFNYNPAQGNLLVEIMTPSTSPVNDFTEAYYESDNSGSLTSRYCDENECNEGQGLVTRFDGTNVPESSSLSYLLFGLGAAALASVRRRTAFHR
jgi:hypothetical protein